ncbi:glycosyltransferase family 2 protein [Paraburkholderia sp.]|uniref:glycosyltransferase family 2 protein n=1 Tax=Paraburkholderia sp. TaxID=1926495 RepID=UPI003D6FC7E0
MHGGALSGALHPLRAGVVVVFYNPDVACVVRANRLAAMMHCVVVDNSPSPRTAGEVGLSAAINYLPNGANLGIATAINQGVASLIHDGFDTAILFDQDSDPSKQLLDGLPRLLEDALRRHERVALIGPAYEDSRLGDVAPFVRFGYLKLRRVPPAGVTPIDVDFLISSGSCINLDAWREIGPMDDALFIDLVDLEWCVRARSKGFTVLGAPELRLAHELGGEPVRVFGRLYPSHSPLRHYYHFRNAVALIKRSYVPCTWKSTELVKFPFRLAIYGLFLQPRLGHLRMALTGIWHGLIGRMGALEQH